MFDIHAHICDPIFDPDRSEVLKHAQSQGIQAIVVVGDDFSSSKAVLEFCEHFNARSSFSDLILLPCIGIHPSKVICAPSSTPFFRNENQNEVIPTCVENLGQREDCSCSMPDQGLGDQKASVVEQQQQPQEEDATDRQIREMISLIRENRNKIVGIGEIGLDFSPFLVNGNPGMKEAQKKVFVSLIKIAMELNNNENDASEKDINEGSLNEKNQRRKLFLNVHSRSAGRPVLQLLSELGVEESGTPVVMHAFDGKASLATNACSSSSSIYFSISPIVLRDPQTQELASKLPLSRILFESDAPALAPVKGERNEPKNCSMIPDKLVEIRNKAKHLQNENIDREQILRLVSENTLKLLPFLSRQ